MGHLGKAAICIVTPGTREANNGNWRTADRWARMLQPHYRVILQTRWDGSACDAMIALHARRSADSIAEFRARGSAGLAVILTGTDLYKDLPASREAAASLDAATRIAVLQEDARRILEPRWRRKCEVIFQSAPGIRAKARKAGFLDCVVAGHLRAEKDPETLFAAMRRLPSDLRIRVRHFGAPLDIALGRAAEKLAREDPRYRYAGGVTHATVRTAMSRAALLIHPSVVEGGANVVVEAMTCGAAVLASRISGNVGMLGARYPGYFEPRDAAGLAHLLGRAACDAAWLRSLASACRARRALFHPAAETRAVRALAAGLLARAG
jgi:putative glycosyltransferase (TIGR04348 family)